MNKKRKTQTGYAEFSMSDLADAMYGERANDMMRRIARENSKPLEVSKPVLIKTK